MEFLTLPPEVRNCLDALEQEGFPTYAVGGCVRDAVLGRKPQDYDLCTAALPQQIRQVFSNRQLVLAGEKHGTVGVVCQDGVVEITTFRTEGGYRDNRHPDWVRFVTAVEADLARRDFTVNAMAWSPYRGFADPFGGRDDLKNHVLRAVGDPESRFREDSLRILRGIRFSVRYRLNPEPKTGRAMEQLADLTDHLAKERIFEELCKLIPLMELDDLLRYRHILAQVLPPLGPTLDFDQHSPHHAYDVFTHIAHVTAALPAKLPLRWAGLLHDIGKVPTMTRDETGRGHFRGHASVGAEMADRLLMELKAPTALRNQVVSLIRLHMTQIPPDKKGLRRWLGKLGPEGLEDLLTLQEADLISKGVPAGQEREQFPRLRQLLREIRDEDGCFCLRDLAVSGRDLLELGIPAGPELGFCLKKLLDLVMDEQLENRREPLLETAGRIWNCQAEVHS